MPPPNTSASPSPSTRGDEDPQSPTVMLQAYLRSRGMPLTSQNMQRVLTENARGSADIPSLVNDVPSTDPGVGQTGNVAGKVEAAPTRRGGPSFPSPVDLSMQNTLPAPNAQPQGGGGMDLSNIGAMIAAGAGAGTGMWLAGRGRGGAPASIPGAPMPGASVPPPVDPGAGVTTGGVIDYTQLNPDAVRMGDRFDTETPDPLNAAINRAVQPSATGPATAVGPTSATGVQSTPGVTPQEAGGRIIPRPPMPDRTMTGAVPPIPPVPQGLVRTPTGVGLPPSPGFRGPQPRVVVKGLHLY